MSEHKPKIATHEETLELLTEQARNGSVTAAAALARELRAAEKKQAVDEVGDAINKILSPHE